MVSASARAPRVVIAGGGISGAATALRLLDVGFSVHLLVRDLPEIPGIEALPRRTIDLFGVLGVPDLPTAAGGIEVAGPAHVWHEPGRVPSPSVHVDRTVLARHMLACAVARGATVGSVRRLPDLSEVADGAVAAVDATGRAAAWSRPVRTMGHSVAWQFRAPPAAEMSGRVVRRAGWWAYRLGHPSATWVGVVTESGAIDASTAREAAIHLGLPSDCLEERSRRPAWVQAAVDPVAGRRLAVGDAALSHDPIAGQGIRFALATAIAAATTVATWAADPFRHDLASAYYRNLVAAEEARHLRLLAQLAGPDRGPGAGPGPAPAAREVRFGAEVVETALVVGGCVQPGTAIRLPDGTITRWVGAFDLLELARIAADTMPRLLVVARLQELGLDVAAARAVVEWAVARGVLVAGASG